jgi:septin 7
MSQRSSSREKSREKSEKISKKGKYKYQKVQPSNPEIMNYRKLNHGSEIQLEEVKSELARSDLGGSGDNRKPIQVNLGFANLPNQIYRKSVKDGFEFNLMVCGSSGLGKSTLVNSLFLSDIYSPEYPGPSQRVKKTLKVEKTHLTLKENGIQLNLNVVDTPGFGDSVNNDKCWEPIQEYIDLQFDTYLNQESRVNRPVHIPDTRIHICLYFIAPTGHGLKPIDIEFMRRLHDKVNIIPLIAKADTMTPDECYDFKQEILREIEQHKINIYEFPDHDDEEENRLNRKLKERMPFAVIGSNIVLQVNIKVTRQY